MLKKEKTVLPGDILTVEEEYASGPNTFVDNDGNVIATATGEPEFDEEVREVQVNSGKKEVVGLAVGSTVIGRVGWMRDAVVMLQLGYAEKNGKKLQLFDKNAFLNVARVSRDYVKDLKDYFKIGDFVRAKVTDVTPYSVEVSTIDEGFGVICGRERILDLFVKGKEIVSEAVEEEE
jgi:exosome complex RNA-binding protein Csl4